jgi:hypothetical protein
MLFFRFSPHYCTTPLPSSVARCTEYRLSVHPKSGWGILPLRTCQKALYGVLPCPYPPGHSLRRSHIATSSHLRPRYHADLAGSSSWLMPATEAEDRPLGTKLSAFVLALDAYSPLLLTCGVDQRLPVQSVEYRTHHPRQTLQDCCRL